MSVTAQNFEDYDWESEIEESDRPIRQEYSRLFAERESNARTNGDLEAAELFELLHSLTFSHFDLDSDGSPFPNLPEMEQENLQTLAEVFEEFSDAELRARIGDILWIHHDQIEEGCQFALQAIDAYLESASRLEGELGNQETLRRMRRADQLAMTMKNDKRKVAVQDAIEQ